MENAPWVLARAEQARAGRIYETAHADIKVLNKAERLAHQERDDPRHLPPEASAHGFHDVNKSLEDVHAFGSRSHLSSIQAAIASSAVRLIPNS
jgi:hypothetical protein